jgi:hypothetical protein
MRWVTRAGVHIDRAACAWLIRRHVERTLALTGPLFDGLYEYHRRALLLDRPPAGETR